MIRQPTGSAEMRLGSVQALPPTKGVDLNPFLASQGFNAPPSVSSDDVRGWHLPLHLLLTLGEAGFPELSPTHS